MTWAYHHRDDAQIRRAFVAVALYGTPEALLAAAEEMERHMSTWPIPSDVDEMQTAAGAPESHRLVVFGVNHRPWVLGRLRRQLATVRGIPVRVGCVADTGADNYAEFTWDVLLDDAGVIMSTFDSFAGAGEGAVAAAQGLAEGTGTALEGVGDGAQPLGDGIGAAARGVGDAAAGFGSAAQSAGGAIAANPISGTLLTVVAVGLGFYVAVKAGIIKPVRVGR